MNTHPSIKIFEATTEDGERATVHKCGDEFTVRFYNKDGIYMDASDFVTLDEVYAIQMATPDDEDDVDWMGLHHGKNA